MDSLIFKIAQTSVALNIYERPFVFHTPLYSRVILTASFYGPRIFQELFSHMLLWVDKFSVGLFTNGRSFILCVELCVVLFGFSN